MARKVKEGSRTYNQRVADVMSAFAPEIYPCYHCGNPVADGWCCVYCKSGDPQGHEENKE